MTSLLPALGPALSSADDRLWFKRTDDGGGTCRVDRESEGRTLAPRALLCDRLGMPRIRQSLNDWRCQSSRCPQQKLLGECIAQAKNCSSLAKPGTCPA